MTSVRNMLSAIVFAAAAAEGASAQAPREVIPVAPTIYQRYDCDTLAVFGEALRTETAIAGRDDLNARYGDYAITRPIAEMTPEEAARRLAWLRGHHQAVNTVFARNACQNRLSGGVGSGAVWSMDRSKIIRFRKAVERAPFQAPPPVDAAAAPLRAPGAPKQPYPIGANVAPPIAYSASEVARYCEQGWDHRALGDGTIEYNPCFYE